MPSHMVGHEALDEPIGMVVAGVAAEGQVLAGSLRGVLQSLRVQLA